MVTLFTRFHSLSLAVPFAVTRYHSLSFAVPLVATRCHQLSPVVPLVARRCNLLSFVVTRCTTRCHSLSTRCTTRLSFYKRSIQQPLSYLRCFCIKLLVRCLTVQNTYLEKKLLRFYNFFILKKKYLKAFLPQNIFTRRPIFR